MILEPPISDTVKQQLADMGHHINKNTDTFGGYQGIWREENPRRHFGGSDPRKDGGTMGY